MSPLITGPVLDSRYSGFMPPELTRSMVYSQSKPFDIQLRDHSKPYAGEYGDLRMKMDLDKRVSFGQNDKSTKDQVATQGNTSSS